jgi:hypothetical protein
MDRQNAAPKPRSYAAPMGIAVRQALISAHGAQGVAFRILWRKVNVRQFGED